MLFAEVSRCCPKSSKFFCAISRNSGCCVEPGELSMRKTSATGGFWPCDPVGDPSGTWTEGLLGSHWVTFLFSPLVWETTVRLWGVPGVFELLTTPPSDSLMILEWARGSCVPTRFTYLFEKASMGVYPVGLLFLDDDLWDRMPFRICYLLLRLLFRLACRLALARLPIVRVRFTCTCTLGFGPAI